MMKEIPNCFAIWEGGSETLPYGWCTVILTLNLYHYTAFHRFVQALWGDMGEK